MTGILPFISYMVVAIALLVVFILIYERFTPYNEWAEIKNGNYAAAIALVGAIVGFTMPLSSAIFFTHSLLEMVKWAIITGAVQIALFAVLQRIFKIGEHIADVRSGVAYGILVAGMSIAIGILNAISISS